MERRETWALPSATATPTTTRAYCTPFTLPSNGVLELAASQIITLTANAVFQPECTGSPDSILIFTNDASSHSSTLTDFRDPFYASTLPECYALAACTVIAYMLFIMLLITPRTFLIEGAVVLGRRGFTNGPSGSDAGIGIGGRPWLQKVAAATVAISLTIATADTLRVAEQQYNQGFQDAAALQNSVEDGTELKVIRVISDTFLWLAQAQTLIRLFPRQREKIIIKWTAFALITLDVLFGILNNFVYDGSNRPASFVDAVPALAYLFQLALSLLYCAWVLYYALTKKQYAFYHPQMRNICLVALLSSVSVLVPVVFFVLDISKPTLAGWGDYVRWVGAAAASVVVWEWVERIEALERNDRKDGVLGREVFDGDEMLEVTPSEPDWTQKFRNRKDDDGDGNGATSTGVNGRWPVVTGFASRYRARFAGDVEAGNARAGEQAKTSGNSSRLMPPIWPTRPAPVATPISRTDTASAESTVYAIRYHPISEAAMSNVGQAPRPQPSEANDHGITETRDSDDTINELIEAVPVDAAKPIVRVSGEGLMDKASSEGDRKPKAWQAIAISNPFRRRNQGAPLEVAAHTMKVQETLPPHAPSNKWDVRTRIEEFAAVQAEKMSQKKKQEVASEPLAVTVIPAPVRRRNLLADVEEMDNETRLMPTTSNTTDLPLSGTTVALSQSSIETPVQTRSPNDRYTPSNIQQQTISHQGSISFVNPMSPERRQGDSNTPLSPTEGRTQLSSSRSNLTSSVLSSSTTQQGGAHTVNSKALPSYSIPAPPRRPRVEEDE